MHVDEEGDGIVTAPEETGLTDLVFVPVDDPKVVKNRVHLDLDSQSLEDQAAVEAAAGARESVGDALLTLIEAPDSGAALALCNELAPEHLQIACADAAALAAGVRTAGCVFVGAEGATAFGDYAAGSNHVLPTSGTARHSSGLSVQTFLRGIHVIDYDQAALKEIAPTVVALADAEGLPAHGEAVRARFEDLAAREEDR